jgi:hypothetical protein
MNLQTLRSIMQSEMRISIVDRVRELDRFIKANRETGGKTETSGQTLGNVLIVMTAAALILSAFIVLSPEPPESSEPQSWITQTRVNLKRQLFSITEKISPP